MKRFQQRLTIVLCLIYLLVNFSVIFGIGLGMTVPGWVTFLATGVCFTFTVFHSGQRLGWLPALTLLAACFVISLLFESVGVATGLVYGAYHYSGRLGPKFLGLVPYLIPVAWFMMMYPSFLIARILIPPTDKKVWRLLSVAALGGVVMTAWDLIMDPMMAANGHWVWVTPGAYFGVPLQNYWGWWLTTFVTFIVFLVIWPRQLSIESTKIELAPSWDRWAYLSYLATGLGNGFTAALMGLTGPALVGLFSMGPWLLLAWWKNAALSKS